MELEYDERDQIGDNTTMNQIDTQEYSLGHYNEDTEI